MPHWNHCKTHMPIIFNFSSQRDTVSRIFTANLQGEADLMGIFSPRTGAPSMISYLASVSLSFLAAVPVPVCSRRRISISMCFSFIRTWQPGSISSASHFTHLQTSCFFHGPWDSTASVCLHALLPDFAVLEADICLLPVLGCTHRCTIPLWAPGQ